MEQAHPGQVADGPLNSVALVERIQSEAQLAGQLLERQNLRVDVEDFSQDSRLVAVVLVGGGRGALMAGATRLVMHREHTLLVPCPRLLAQRGGAFVGSAEVSRAWRKTPQPNA